MKASWKGTSMHALTKSSAFLCLLIWYAGAMLSCKPSAAMLKTAYPFLTTFVSQMNSYS